MFATDKFVWIHFIKTGGTLIRDFFRAMNFTVWQSPWDWGAHCGVDRIPEKYQHLPIFSNVRNPWDWYISWYEFFRLEAR